MYPSGSMYKSKCTEQEDGSMLWEGYLACAVCGYGPVPFRERWDWDMIANVTFCPTCGEALYEASAAKAKREKIAQWFNVEE